MGKGSGRRPGNEKALESNWDRIFNNKAKADWEDEIVAEEHNESLREKNHGSITNPENTKKTKG